MADADYPAGILLAIEYPAPTEDERLARARERYGAHVVRVIGEHLPWENIGRVAIEHFGCPEGTVYFIGGEVGAIKIGYSTYPLNRLAAMHMGSPIPLRILALVRGSKAMERSYHQRFAAHRLHGEWFERCPEIEAEIIRLNAAEVA